MVGLGIVVSTHKYYMKCTRNQFKQIEFDPFLQVPQKAVFDEILTQNTSYINSPTRSRVDTFKLGNRTRAMNATQRPIPRAEK